MPTERPKVVFYPSKELHEKLKEESEKNDLSVSKIIQQIIQNHYKEKDKNQSKEDNM